LLTAAGTTSAQQAPDPIVASFREYRAALDRGDLPAPSEALFRYGVGAVVAHFALDADGTVRARTIAASIPPGPLAEAFAKTLPNWRVAMRFVLR
jgi:hypothetical protein